MIDFSIIIATRNREILLKQAIESIFLQKGITYEIIIIDDDSEDDTGDMINQYIKEGHNIRYIRNKESCFAHESRRIGYAHAQGEYIVFMDDDDFYMVNCFFAEVKNIFENNPNVCSVIASTVFFKGNKMSEAIDLGGNGIIDNVSYFNGFGERYQKPCSTLSAVFKKETLDKQGLGSCPMVNDTCIFLYGILRGDVYLLNQPVAAYRIHETNITKNSFSVNFVTLCLNEKKKIYAIACDKGLLLDKKTWFFVQLRQSIVYFLSCAHYDLYLCFHVILWLAVHGKGVRIRFMKEYIQKMKAQVYK